MPPVSTSAPTACAADTAYHPPPLQHRHEALFADIALHEILVCGKQEATPVLQPRHGVDHEIVLVAARNAEEADFHGFFPEEQRRIFIRFAAQSAQFMFDPERTRKHVAQRLIPK